MARDHNSETVEVSRETLKELWARSDRNNPGPASDEARAEVNRVLGRNEIEPNYGTLGGT